jgi:hypothetical protein
MTNPFPGGTPSIKIILAALNERFPGEKWLDGSRNPDGQWSPGTPTRGIYNRRKIQPRNVTWSQHSWSNASDLGWLYGIAEQQRIYDFLTGKEQHVAYEEIAGYKFYDVDDWPKWADASIRAAIADGDMIGKSIDPNDPTKREFAPNDPVIRAELAIVLKRNALT